MGTKGTIKSFRDLIAWQKAISIALRIYEATKPFPKEEQFGLTSQMRRLAVSISSNIAEGFGRQTAADKGRFYTMALGSNNELQSQVSVAAGLHFFPEDTAAALDLLLEESRDLIHGIMRSASSY